jgi:hypothetical protein
MAVINMHTVPAGDHAGSDQPDRLHSRGADELAPPTFALDPFAYPAMRWNWQQELLFAVFECFLVVIAVLVITYLLWKVSQED